MNTLANEEKATSLTQMDEEQDNSLITTLPPKIQRFVHLYTTGQYSNAKLADLLQVHPNTILNWLKRKDVKQVIAELQESTHDMVGHQLKNLTLKAVNKLHQLIDSPIDGVALQAVRDVLDRAGHKSKQEIKIDKTVTTVEQKLKTLIDETIDAEFEVIEVDDDDEEA